MSTASLERLVELAPSGLVVLDPNGIVLRANSAASQVFGTGTLTGVRIEQFLGDPTSAAIREAYRLRVPYPAVGTSLAVGRDGSGSEFPLQLALGPLGPSRDDPWGLAVRDLREREALVQALTERAAELARSNRDLEQFAYVASHDLQEPIRMISSYTQLLLRRYAEQIDPSAREFLGFTLEGAQRMQHLVDDLLRFARIGSRGCPFEPVALETVLGDALQNLGPTLAEADAEVTHGPLSTIDGDAVQLTELFQNLIGNAIKYRSTEPPRIHVSERSSPDEVTLAFQDNGLGILPEHQERVFAIFQRLHLPEEYEGTGIGLAVAKKVVERHGGRIWVESQGVPGAGSTFRITLPRHGRAPSAGIPLSGLTPRERSAHELADDLVERRLRQLA